MTTERKEEHGRTFIEKKRNDHFFFFGSGDCHILWDNGIKNEILVAGSTSNNPNLEVIGRHNVNRNGGRNKFVVSVISEAHDDDFLEAAYQDFVLIGHGWQVDDSNDLQGRMMMIDQ